MKPVKISLLAGSVASAVVLGLVASRPVASARPAAVQIPPQAPSNIEKTLAEIPELPQRSADLNPPQRCQLIRRWSERDAPAAAAWALKLPAGRERDVLLEQVALGWAARDLAGAFAWAARLPADAPASFLIATLGLELSRTDPLEALDVAAQLPASPLRDELFRHAVSEWCVTDPEAAEKWARSVREEPLRSTVLRAVATVALARTAGTDGGISQ